MNQIFFYEQGKQRGNAFTFIINTNNISTGSSTATQFALPLLSNGFYNMVVDWGDSSTSTITVWNEAATIHTYSVAGNYTIKITGTCNGWRFNNTGDRLKFLSVSKWGPLKLNHTTPASGNFFNGCANLDLSGVGDVLDTSNVTSFINIFQNCTALTTINRVGEWITSNVTTMQAAFDGCSNFNGAIGTWNTSNVIGFGALFRNCFMFNQNVGSWVMNKATSISQMFYGCTAFNNGGSPDINNWVLPSSGATISAFEIFRGCSNFNQPVGNWNTNRVSSMQGMFHNCTVFNQNIGNWDTSNAVAMANMFQSATAFNNGGSPSISGWTTSANTTTTSMFQLASSFNQPVGSWNMNLVQFTASMFNSATAFNNGLASGVAGTIPWTLPVVTNVSNMFQLCANFNQNVGSFNTANCASFGNMFNGCTVFNNGGSPSISGWTTSSGTTFASVFLNAPAFNQPLTNWNVSNATSFASMFNTATAFNQNIGHFRPSLATNIANFMSNKTAANYSTANLDAIYNGWTQGALQPSISTTFGTIKYTAAATAARALLTRTNATQTVTGAVNNGSGLIRITTGTVHGRTTGDKVYVSGVGGVPNATGGWIVTVISTTQLDLQGSTFAGTFTSGGTNRTGYGWTIVDGGL